MGKDKTLQKKIGERVKDIREVKEDMSKEDFSKKIGMLKSYLVSVENGDSGLTVERTVKISEETNISTDFILRGIENSLIQFAKDNLGNYTDKEIEKSFELLKTLTLLIKHIWCRNMSQIKNELSFIFNWQTQKLLGRICKKAY